MRSRKCELCSNIARIHCGSDQASLCCECDSKVHGANFLVAKHLRTLLCCVCQSPTPWTGSGPKLGPTVSVCQTCLSATRQAKDGQIDGDIGNLDHGNGHHDDDDDDDRGEAYDAAQNGDYDDDDDDDVDDDVEDEEEEEDDDDDEDNQVVPWSY